MKSRCEPDIVQFCRHMAEGIECVGRNGDPSAIGRRTLAMKTPFYRLCKAYLEVAEADERAGAELAYEIREGMGRMP